MPRTNLLIGALLAGSVIVSGCAAVPYAAVGAANVITDANRSSYSDVSVTLTPGYQLDGIKRVRFETGSDETEGITMMTRDESITQTLVDNLIREFLVD